MPEHREDELIEHIARELRSGVRFDAGFDAQVMAAIRAEAPLVTRSAAIRLADARMQSRDRTWLVRPRAFRVSPLAGLAAAAGFAGIVAASTLALRSEGTAPVTPASLAVGSPASDTQVVRVVQFVLRAPSASSVALVGDFNEWNPTVTPLRPISRDGTWTVSLPLAPGRHVYAFVVDGEEWVADPAAPVAPGDDFGVPNSVVTVGSSS